MASVNSTITKEVKANEYNRFKIAGAACICIVFPGRPHGYVCGCCDAFVTVVDFVPVYWPQQSSNRDSPAYLFVVRLLRIVHVRQTSHYVPRLGRVEFGKHRKSRERQLWLIMAVSVSVTILLMLLAMGVLRSRIAYLGSMLEHTRYIGVFFAVNVFVIFSFIAYFMNFTRAYFIGAVLSAGLAFDIAYDRSVLLGMGGLLIMVIGLVYFMRFIRTYPVSFEQEMEDANGRA